MSLRPLSLSARLVFVFVALALCACQQAAWKAGASADDLKRDQQACVAQTEKDDAAIKQCLRGKGWAVADGSALINNNDDKDTASTSATSPSAAPSNPTPHDAAVSRKPDGGATKPSPPDPLQKQSVQTWWKAGAQAADFTRDASVCLEQLGEQHTPDYAQHLFTRAMVSCLRTRGWSAGSDPVYTPPR